MLAPLTTSQHWVISVVILPEVDPEDNIQTETADSCIGFLVLQLESYVFFNTLLGNDSFCLLRTEFMDASSEYSRRLGVLPCIRAYWHCQQGITEY